VFEKRKKFSSFLNLLRSLFFFFLVKKKSMSSRVFVGNLSRNADNEFLSEHFSQYGQVTDAVIIQDRETGKFFYLLYYYTVAFSFPF
jgi:CRISPR/Cas system-associated protein endoribonuclease Cas2